MEEFTKRELKLIMDWLRHTRDHAGEVEDHKAAALLLSRAEEDYNSRD